MTWKKLGQVFKMSKISNDILTHASNPLPVHLEGDIYRVFYSGRNKNNKSSVSYVDIDLVTSKVVYTSLETTITFGEDNSFYSHGISIGNCYKSNNNLFILFMGWQLREGKHWKGDIGRLKLEQNTRLLPDPETPFLSCDAEDPISLSYPWVLFHDGIYKMWYGSTLSWTSTNGEMIHVIKYATSLDGETWIKHGLAIPFEVGVAQAFSKPSVIINATGYHMWYSYRSGDGTPYRIGYSHSANGVDWERKHDEVGIDVSKTGWDSDMLCYPFVLEHKTNTYMFYNGNDFGKTGFGLAILE